MNIPASFQIGKFGMTPGVIDALSLVLKTHKQVRIAVLKASGRDKEKTRAIAQQLIHALAAKTHHAFTTRIIGFTIILRRHAK